MCFFIKHKIAKTVLKLKIMQQNRIHNQPTDEAIRQEITLYMKMAHWYARLRGKKRWPFAYEAELACLRQAAALDYADAQFYVGKALLDAGKFRDSLQKGEVFASVSNEHAMTTAYQEAHAFLKAAVAHNHIEAKRLLGLCYIYGFGVPINKSTGFNLIIESIEEEGSWDHVQKVLSKIGVNNAAFLSELFKHRANNDD